MITNAVVNLDWLLRGLEEIGSAENQFSSKHRSAITQEKEVLEGASLKLTFGANSFSRVELPSSVISAVCFLRWRLFCGC